MVEETYSALWAVVDVVVAARDVASGAQDCVHLRHGRGYLVSREDLEDLVNAIRVMDKSDEELLLRGEVQE